MMAVASSLRRAAGLLLFGLLLSPPAAGAAEDEAATTAPASLVQAFGEGGGEVEPPAEKSFFSMDWLFGGSEEKLDEAAEGEAEVEGEPNTKVDIPIAPPLGEEPEPEVADFDQGDPDEAGIVEKNPTRRYSLFGSSDEEEPQAPDETAPELGGEPESLALPVVPDAVTPDPVVAPEVPSALQEVAPIEAVEEVPLPELPAAVGAQPDQGGSPQIQPPTVLVEELVPDAVSPDGPTSPESEVSSEGDEAAPVLPLVAEPLPDQPELPADQGSGGETAPESKVGRLGDALDELRDLNPVVALVQGQEVRWAEVLESAGDLPVKYQSQVEAIFPALLDRIIDMKLLTLAARQDGLSANQDLRRRVTDYEDRLLRELYVKQRLGRLVTQEGVKLRYDALVKRLGSKQHLRARHILVESEAEALDLVAVLEAGGDFETLARENSIGPSAERGGDLGYFDPKRMVPQFSEAALAMEIGTFTREPVETPFGWHVIQLIDRRFTGVPPFEEMEASLREQLTQEVMDGVLGELRAANEIELFPETPEDQLRRMSAAGTPGAAADEAGATAE